MRYFGVVSYFGMNYCGWQTQPNHKGIEDKIEKILSSILDEKITIVGAGRTDKGVHALGQCFHFDTKKKINDLNHLLYVLNRLLPKDIQIRSLREINNEFHARFSAKQKEYLYKIYVGNNIPFYLHTHWVMKPINISLLKQASKIFIGRHNFQNLTSKEKDPKGFIRTIKSISVNKHKDEIYIRLIGDSFMRYMVRDIVAEMVEAAKLKKSLSSLNALFKGPRHITQHKAPPEGLYLIKVSYED